MKPCSTFIVGATFWGIGFAATQQDVFVADPTINPGHEFADTFCDHVCPVDCLKTELAREFYRILKSHNALECNRLHPPALIPLLSAFILEHKINILLSAVLTDNRLDEKHGVHRLSLMTTAGMRKFSAKCVFDTLTPLGKIQRKEFTAILHSVAGTAVPAELLTPTGSVAETPYLSQGRFASEAILHFPCSPETGYCEARAAVENFWKNRPSSLGDWRIAATAQEFFEIPEKMPARSSFSKGYGDPLSAFDAGVQEAML